MGDGVVRDKGRSFWNSARRQLAVAGAVLGVWSALLGGGAAAAEPLALEDFLSLVVERHGDVAASTARLKASRSAAEAVAEIATAVAIAAAAKTLSSKTPF